QGGISQPHRTTPPTRRRSEGQEQRAQKGCRGASVRTRGISRRARRRDILGVVYRRPYELGQKDCFLSCPTRRGSDYQLPVCACVSRAGQDSARVLSRVQTQPTRTGCPVAGTGGHGLAPLLSRGQPKVGEP